MTWTKLDDSFPDHPKIMGLSDAAFRLYVTGLCYANRQLTDGLVPKAWPPIKRKALSELLATGLWQDVGDSFSIHDFLIYNKPRSEVMATRQQNATAGAKGALSRWHRSSNGPVPDPTRPVPKEPAAAARERHVDLERAIKAWERQSPGSINPTIIDALDWWLGDDLPVEWVERACEEAGLAGGRKPVRFVDAILRRYRNQGTMEDVRPEKAAAPFVSGLDVKHG